MENLDEMRKELLNLLRETDCSHEKRMIELELEVIEIEIQNGE